MQNDYKEAYFDKYCKACDYENTPEKCDPCNDCLSEAMNQHSNKPVSWKEKNGK